MYEYMISFLGSMCTHSLLYMCYIYCNAVLPTSDNLQPSLSLSAVVIVIIGSASVKEPNSQPSHHTSYYKSRDDGSNTEISSTHSLCTSIIDPPFPRTFLALVIECVCVCVYECMGVCECMYGCV